MMAIRRIILNNIAYIYSFILLHNFCVSLVYLRQQEKINASTDRAIIIVKLYGPRFYTVWNIVLQSFYCTIGLLAHFWPKSEQITDDLLRKIKGYTFVTLVGPCTIFAAYAFWSLYLIDRELVCPKEIDLVFHDYLKHATHTTILVLLIVEIILANQFVPKVQNCLIGFAIYRTLYITTFVGTYFQTGVWIYHLYEVITWTTRISIIIYESLSSFCVMLLLNRYIRSQSNSFIKNKIQ